MELNPIRPDCTGWTDLITQVLKIQKPFQLQPEGDVTEEGESELHTASFEKRKGVVSQVMWVASRRWKKQENIFLYSFQKGIQAW